MDANALLTQVFNSDPFSLVNMTSALIEKAHVGSEMSKVLNWSVVKSKTTYMAVDRKTKGIHLVGTVARGAPLPQYVPYARDMYQLPIPRTGERGEVTVDEILDKRKFGELAPEDMAELRDERMTDTRDALENTDNFAKGMALRGIVVDAVTGAQLFDLKEVRGKIQKSAFWDLTTVNPNELVSRMKEELEDTMGDAPVSGDSWKILAGRKAFRALRQNKYIVRDTQVTAAIANLAADRLGFGDTKLPGGKGSFPLSENVEVIKMGRDRYNVVDQNPASPTFGQVIGSQGVIPDWAMVLVPDSPGLFQTGYGPSSKVDFVGNILPYYVTPYLKRDRTGIEWEVDTFRINIMARPELAYWIYVTKGDDGTGNTVNGYALDGTLSGPLAQALDNVDVD